MTEYEFSLQYPKPLMADEIREFETLLRSGDFSRYTSDVTDLAERGMAEMFGTKHAVACSSGTGAIHAALIALDLPVGSEVITTSVTDVGVVLPIIYQNLIPVFADLDPTTFNLDPRSVEAQITPRTSAVIAVHLAGNPCPLDELKQICDRAEIVLIEDCSQAHGAEYKGDRVGGIGAVGVASLQQSKHISSGEGGVIVTDDDALFERLKLAVDKGWTRHKGLKERRYEFLSLNYRFTGLQAATLIPQLKRLDSILGKKRKLASHLYSRAQEFAPTIHCQRVLEGALSSYYSFPMYVTANEAFRNEMLGALEALGIRSAYGYANPLPLYRCVAALEDPVKFGRGFEYAERKYLPGLCPVAEDLLSRSFLIPFNERFEISDMDAIMDRLGEAISQVVGH
jgi:perosamine synthetase